MTSLKKVLTTIGLFCAVVGTTQAQGLVNFTSSTQNTTTNDTLGLFGAAGATGKIQGAGNYYFALLYSTTTPTLTAQVGAATVQALNNSYASAANGWTLVTEDVATNTATPGRFLGAGNADSSTTVNGLAAGSAAYFCVIGWSANLGATWAAADAALVSGTAGFLGQSGSSGLISTGDGIRLTTPGLFGASAPSIQGFSLGATQLVPEPTTIALAALGGAAMLFIRRKK